MKKLDPKMILILLIVILVGIFSIQNSEIVVVKFLIWKITMPQVFLILGSVAFGVIIGVLYPIRRKKK